LEHRINIRQLFNPTRGQIVFTSLGLLLYFMYQSFHEKIFGVQQTLANTVIYISDVISILLICTFSAVALNPASGVDFIGNIQIISFREILT
jgi:hypothetical protein